MKTPYKMGGMSFKEDQTPLKTLNLSKIASKIKSSKFGQSKLGQGVGNLVEKGSKVQEKFIEGKRKLGLKTTGYDATLDKEELTESYKPEVELKDISGTPTPEAGVDLERVKVGPIEKRTKGTKKRSGFQMQNSPAKIYSKPKGKRTKY